MTRTAFGLTAVALLAAFTWGCGRGQENLAQTNKTLETKLAKLQGDLADLNARVLDLDRRLAKEQAHARAVEAERDAVATRLKSRTDERDALQGHFDGLVKTLESALGQAKAARAGLSPNPTAQTQAVMSAIQAAPGGW